ncbi:uncharacterized protein LOC103485453 [Cucumis melo]|uniref:Ribosomal RNA-processing protein 42 n=1 Tax=Cucumis melo TaxID=3656 RepID=A0ABM3KLI8_CUCME|nr:uncharacterized protein LOC103485453 [Cucumis melo]
MVGLSTEEKLFIQVGISQDLGTDGRGRLTYRPISIETDVISQANGSTRVRIGGIEVIIATVKGHASNSPAKDSKLGRPNPIQHDKGKVSISVDCSPTAELAFEVGLCGSFAPYGLYGLRCMVEKLLHSCPFPERVDSCVWLVFVLFYGFIEVKETIGFLGGWCLLGGKSGSALGAGIDLSTLIVVERKLCWDLHIEGLVLSSEGNLLNALGAAIKSNTSGVSAIFTLTKVGKHYIIDATLEEESQMSSTISISINRHGHIYGLTKRGGVEVDISIILDMISVGKHVSDE